MIIDNSGNFTCFLTMCFSSVEKNAAGKQKFESCYCLIIQFIFFFNNLLGFSLVWVKGNLEFCLWWILYQFVWLNFKNCVFWYILCMFGCWVLFTLWGIFSWLCEEKCRILCMLDFTLVSLIDFFENLHGMICFLRSENDDI